MDCDDDTDRGTSVCSSPFGPSRTSSSLPLRQSSTTELGNHVTPDDDDIEIFDTLNRDEIWQYVFLDLEHIADKETRESKSLARRIVYVLRQGIIPCPPERHLANHQAHMDQCPDHGTLEDTYRPRGMGVRATKADNSDGFGLSRGKLGGPIDSGLRGKDREWFPSGSRLKSEFTGLTPERGPESQICLHHPQYQGTRIKPARFDVDSAMSVFTHLGELRHALKYCPTPQRTTMLGKSLHIEVAIETEKDGRSKRRGVPIHRIPHILFGRVQGHPLFIFFPRMYKGAAELAKLTNDQYRRLYDNVILPSIKKVFGEDVTQHLPPTFEIALSHALAKDAEGSGSSAARGKPLDYDLAAPLLGRFWDAVSSTLAAPWDEGDRLWEFGEPFFLYDCANHKLQFRSEGSVNECLDKFWKDHGGRIKRFSADETAPRALTQQYIDLAAEFLPKEREGHDGSVLLPRRCCQYNTINFLFAEKPKEALWETNPDLVDVLMDEASDAGLPDGSEGPQLRPKRPFCPKGAVNGEWNLFTLRDTASVTCEPKPGSWLSAIGLQYFQSYSVTKEIFSAVDVLPFSYKRLPHLAYGATQWSTEALNGGFEKSRDKQRKALSASIQRVNRILLPSNGYESPLVDSNIGHRLEFRITPEFSDSIRLEEASYCAAVTVANGETPGLGTVPLGLHDRDHNSQISRAVCRIFDFRQRTQVLRNYTPPNANAFFFIPQTEFRNFLCGNVSKHLSAIDSILAFFDPSDVGQGYIPSMVITLFGHLLLSLRHFLSFLPHKERWVLHNSTARAASRDGRTRSGLGLGKSMEIRGFAFWPELVDWKKFEFKTCVVGEISDADGQPLNELPPTPIEFDDNTAERIFALYEEDGLTDVQAQFVHEVVVDFVLHAYRRTVITKLCLNFRRAPGTMDMWRRISLEFTLQGLHMAILDNARQETNVVIGNRSGNLLKPEPFFTWLFTDKELLTSAKRSNIVNLDFRNFLNQARIRIRQVKRRCESSPLAVEDLERILFYRFFQQHSATVWPDTSTGSLASTNKKGERQLCAWRYPTGSKHVPNSIDEGAKSIRFHSTGFEPHVKDTKVSGLLLSRPVIVSDLDTIEQIENRFRTVIAVPRGGFQ